ncbi:MAG: 50S ribosomal protein L5 [Candidatus Lloydbacteria bacterium RIFCSPLOWO2_01_FULL_50_20]|uniref:Large ribosomal subunit protein uL5 n=1 Tax=Candidatus Lloydbacteria bacterium RIFCSPLOWO2_01_FULL_50_20 TaxID=1798665 RepID=A0A1G2DHY0_9BACT|nr:MAG: 50S ribosomal protein L5 [Candidatus Lloydbacteria bacterium RIFCSPHIGHO2_02_FULL_50_11]OGZ13113.1 MAG: 50S ribosomal protein L5 [Candidatus Lloydbacteria bacterium RIFCSPLOWO2_01_FULL_50_20]
MKSATVKEKLKAAYPKLKEKYGYKNIMQAPAIEKVIVAVGTGKLSRADKKKNEFIAERLAKITGQKPSERTAKKSIASFKLREGEPIGQMVTLRGGRMFGFLDKFINIAIPRTKDFRGFLERSIDTMGNFTVGVKEHTVFPETADEDLRDVFGLAITIVLSTGNKGESKDVLEALGFPFREAAETASRRGQRREKGKK